ncbi:MAG: hypothetical protein QXQ57_07375 [Sulfolobales archaeon]
MELRENDVVVVDASVIATHRRGREVLEKIHSSKAILAVSPKLLQEMRRAVARTGLGPHILLGRLRRLEECSRIILINDINIVKQIPNNIEDSHLANLSFTVKAKAVVTLDKKHRETLRSYGVPIVDIKQFLDC